jgi:hypothetical protein
MSAEIVPPPASGPHAAVTSSPLTQQLVGARVSERDEINGYWFWGLVALFIAIPELLAALSKTLKADIPWPTISNLVGKDLEAHNHGIALIVVGVIIVVTVHTLTYPAEKKKVGRGLKVPAEEAIHLPGAGWYIVAIALAGTAAGLIAWATGADKNEMGYAIFLTLTVFGIVIPSALAYCSHRVLALPTLFATVAFLRAREAWVAALVVALLVVLLFHLALYPWPNYHFGAS